MSLQALFSMLLLGKKFNTRQWLAILLLTVGIVVVQFDDIRKVRDLRFGSGCRFLSARMVSLRRRRPARGPRLLAATTLSGCWRFSACCAAVPGQVRAPGAGGLPPGCKCNQEYTMVCARKSLDHP
jgi:hypothetical protein